jgi:hypothetical protein
MTAKPLKKVTGVAKGNSSGWTNPAWAGITGAGETYGKVTLPKTQANTNWVNPAWAGYIANNKKTGQSYQQVNTDKNPTYGSGAYLQKYFQQVKTPKKHVTNTNPSDTTVPVVPTNNTPAGIKFNLAPHNWSLPINQRMFSTSSTSQTQSDQSGRRARMWCYLGASDSNYADKTQTNTTTAAVVAGGTNVAASLDTQWGFQFLWNPTQIGTSVQRNANLVPQAMDAFAGRAPLFPGTEALSFVAVINRVNDFACFKSLSLPSTTLTDLSKERLDFILQGAASYYPKSAGAVQDTNNLIKELMARGTMADIEYIFKMINGDGANGTTWTNALGRKTSDINFLAPTPVAVQFGPNADSLSYVGWVESISVSHQMFTEDMIPIHSEVTINMSTYSQSSLK